MNVAFRKMLGLGAICIAPALGLSAIVSVSSNITSDTTWTSDNEYILQGIIYVTNGATLTIQPGTIIRGQPNDAATSDYNPGTLVITRGANIDAVGSPGQPIIFTTAAVDNNEDGTPDGSIVVGGTRRAKRWTPGDKFWDANPLNSPRGAEAGLTGGLIVLGKAPTNTDLNPDTIGTVEYRNIEGLPPSDLGRYGGDDPHDSSGRIAYWSIRHGGANISEANEINGLTMGGVGNGTLVEFVEIYYNLDDGFEFFGGTVNTRYLVSIGVDDDHFDADEGHSGEHQFFLAIGGPESDNMGEWDGFESSAIVNKTYRPVTSFKLYNATFIGNRSAMQGNHNGLRVRDDAAPSLFNSIIVNTRTAFRVDGGGGGVGSNNETQIPGVTDSRSRILNGLAVYNHITFHNNATNISAGSPDILNNPAINKGNEVADPGIIYAFTNTGPKGEPIGVNPVPLINGGNADIFTVSPPPPGSGWIQPADYRGAFSDDPFSPLWTTGWTAAWARGAIVTSGS